MHGVVLAARLRDQRLCLPTQLIVVAMQNCGVVAESHIIDEGSEWRTFGDKVRPKICPMPASSGMPS